MRAAVLLATSLLLASRLLVVQVFAQAWGTATSRWSAPVTTKLHPRPPLSIGSLLLRGGDDGNDDDSDRYSRQVYTLGARAHGLVRSSTVFVDGPATSGLLFECIKNLALSGVGTIVLVTSSEETDQNYHYAPFDDLGKTYLEGARAELSMHTKNNDKTVSDDNVLLRYLKYLNPSLHVETVSREKLSTVCSNYDEMSRGIFLCVDRPYTTQKRLNQLSRDQQLSFVGVETAGVYGRVFCDFGKSFQIHDSDGETPLVVCLDKIELLEENESLKYGGPRMLMVHALEGERHDVSKGDEIRFSERSGSEIDLSFRVVKVLNPRQVIVELVEDTSRRKKGFVFNQIKRDASTFSRRKTIEEVAFVSLEKATNLATTDDSVFTPSDLSKSFDRGRKCAIFSCFQGLDEFVRKTGKVPLEEDSESFLATAKKVWSSSDLDEHSWETHGNRFARLCAAKFVPLQALFGALAAQECLKAASGLYSPIRQFLLFDCDEVVPIAQSSEHKGSGLEYILGPKVLHSLQDKRLFVVGAGAIGCEILKNLAAMDLGTNDGTIVLTDMDTIERSNLSRQLLFRDRDVGKFKSVAAKEAIFRLNPRLRLESHTSKVGEDDGPFDDNFWWSKVDIVLNALDNVEARLFMDSQCVSKEKALVDAGTLGSKGNVQVVVPHLSESYGSSPDPPEPAIPVCTLKNFPYMISHTIQWGRDLFDGLFVRRPKQANKYSEMMSQTSMKQLSRMIVDELGDQTAKNTANELTEDLRSFSSLELGNECLSWAVTMAKELFNDTIEKLLQEHPADSLDEEDQPFWSGSRKMPMSLSYRESYDQGGVTQQAVNESLVSFVLTASRLRLETFLGLEATTDVAAPSTEEAIQALVKAEWVYSPKPDDPDDPEQSETSLEQSLLRLEPRSLDSPVLIAADFEKDDDSNGHIDFITAASNLRALCYGIPPVDSMQTRKVAGRIIPAMITTTAFVSAISCIELTKLAQNLPLNRFQNAFINLALPFFAFTSPVPVEVYPGVQGESFTMWDKMVLEESKIEAEGGGITVRQFLTKLKDASCQDPEMIEVSSVNYGEFMVYANFLHEDEDNLLDRSLLDVIQEALDTGADFEAEFHGRVDDTPSDAPHLIGDSSSLNLVVIVEDFESGEEIELPPVVLVRCNVN